ncbi:nuclear transport factor 2 family protein [Vagococcus sp. DIV0080]|uniref:Nuclear transport factor 2 family protein n=1 Tax=Candidatus Vagococcus giribetii TaxID=2230876 RepID=A0ABS3HUJ0_9ENTE|nr:nuclear transport factor 2 family protein [Vagococcus sp. DIV0080]MBO0477418.1 nuclear transport factor 2 family protein [Vagococcus sp. DIV0080]
MEEQTVRKIILNYITDTFEGNADNLDKRFHRNAVMSGYMGDELIMATPSVFVEDIRSRPSMKANNDNYKATITHLSVKGNIAEACIYETGFFGKTNLENYFHLIKNSHGEWQIISKCFTTV